MIYENPIIFIKLLKSNSKENFYKIYRKLSIFEIKNNVFSLIKYN